MTEVLKKKKNQLGWGGVEPKIQYINLAQVVIHMDKDKIDLYLRIYTKINFN